MIYLMRHGEDDNTRLGGWSNTGLSPVGIEQVKNSAKKIIEENYNINYIFSSDLPRAKETAEIIAEHIDLEIGFIREFREINNGRLAGMLKKEANERYHGIYYSALEWEEKYPDGESPKLFYERISSAWKNFKNDISGNALLVTHGGVIDIILCCENRVEYTNKYLN
ncbi:MAG: histidine phosphatase family protein [Oscillospiraceae bacterium]|nr:histidine phosphatase family protein [Oscillospiraceae bacterium]